MSNQDTGSIYIQLHEHVQDTRIWGDLFAINLPVLMACRTLYHGP